jgi:hypothetical protein
MKLDVDPFPIDEIDFTEKKLLVRQDQESTKGKNVLVSDELRQKMLKPKDPEVGMWKENVRREHRSRWRPTSNFLIEKYTMQHRTHIQGRLGGRKRERSLRYSSEEEMRTAHWYQG